MIATIGAISRTTITTGRILRLRQAAALPVYAVALILDYLSEVLGKAAAWIADDDWP